VEQGAVTAALITVLVPYYNEAGYLGRMLGSLASQSDRRFKLVLIDNGSTDGSPDIARRIAGTLSDIEVLHLDEPNPGKLHAIRAGIAHVTTRYIATCDADTIYPANYIANCLALFRQHTPPIGVMAIDLHEEPDSPASRRRIRKILRKSKLFSSACHAGGYAQSFDMAALAKVGGLLNPEWPYVLEDHEVVNRAMKLGRIAYAAHHYCFPSQRRSDRRDVSWTSWERTVYRFTPQRLKGWFFYQYLGPRFERRGLVNLKLRNRNWL
jgi:glycosyltransferase involved in cell wall biosynthesis